MGTLSAWIAIVSLLGAQAGSLVDELTQQGVRLSTGQQVPVRAPLMPDGLDPATQQQVLRQAADRYPLDRFLRDSVVSPFVLEIESIDDGTGRRTGQRVSFYFVAYGSLDALLDEDLFRELAGAQESGAERPMSARTLTDEELQARGLVARDDDDVVESFVAVEANVLERVLLSGVGQSVQRQTDESLVGAWRLDDRFLDDPQFANRWRPIVRDELGREALGEPVPYTGIGGYIKVTRLHEPAGALFVECHSAFDEPYGWFDGRNLLRSKLPLVVQDNVRTFRRRLARATEDAAPTPAATAPPAAR